VRGGMGGEMRKKEAKEGGRETFPFLLQKPLSRPCPQQPLLHLSVPPS
jgi:hypothetical protein